MDLDDEYVDIAPYTSVATATTTGDVNATSLQQLHLQSEADMVSASSQFNQAAGVGLNPATNVVSSAVQEFSEHPQYHAHDPTSNAVIPYIYENYDYRNVTVYPPMVEPTRQEPHLSPSIDPQPGPRPPHTRKTTGLPPSEHTTSLREYRQSQIRHHSQHAGEPENTGSQSYSTDVRGGAYGSTPSSDRPSSSLRTPQSSQASRLPSHPQTVSTETSVPLPLDSTFSSKYMSKTSSFDKGRMPTVPVVHPYDPTFTSSSIPMSNSRHQHQPHNGRTILPQEQEQEHQYDRYQHQNLPFPHQQRPSTYPLQPSQQHQTYHQSYLLSDTARSRSSTPTSTSHLLTVYSTSSGRSTPDSHLTGAGSPEISARRASYPSVPRSASNSALNHKGRGYPQAEEYDIDFNHMDMDQDDPEGSGPVSDDPDADADIDAEGDMDDAMPSTDGNDRGGSSSEPVTRQSKGKMPLRGSGEPVSEAGRKRDGAGNAVAGGSRGADSGYAVDSSSRPVKRKKKSKMHECEICGKQFPR